MIITPEDIEKWIEEINTSIKKVTDISDPQGIFMKLEELSNLTGLSSQCVATAEMFLNQKTGDLCMMKDYIDRTASDKKMIFAKLAAKEQYLFTFAERQNAGLVHSIESLRSQLSWLKSELQISQQVRK